MAVFMISSVHRCSPTEFHTLKRGVSIGPLHVNLILHEYLGASLAVRIFSKLSLLRKLLLPLGAMREHPSQVVFALRNRWKVNDCLKQYYMTVGS